MERPTEVTALLQRLSQGERTALDRLMPVVYDELRSMARAQLRNERTGHTLNTTGLVHEAYMRLVDVESVQWQDRAHFCAVAARMMRRVLIDYARSRRRVKRGGDPVRIPLDEAVDLPAQTVEEWIDLDDALTRLEALNERQCRVVELRCFAGMTIDETAEALGTSTATVKRDWAFSRAWLNRELAPDRAASGDGVQP